jgi:hypothetical protein
MHVLWSELIYIISPLREIANPTSLALVPSSPSSLVHTLEAQRYKQQFELLEAQYRALLETKEKISKQFREQLMKWRKFKHWLVKEEVQCGRRLSIQRRISRKRKAMEQIGPHLCPQGEDLGDTSILAVDNEVVANPEDILAKPLDNNLDTKDLLAPSPNRPRFEESLTQPSSVTASQRSVVTGQSLGPLSSTRPRDPFVVNNDIPLSQQSLTQPSSPVSLSPVRVPKAMLRAIPQYVARPTVLVVDSPPR